MQVTCKYCKEHFTSPEAVLSHECLRKSRALERIALPVSSRFKTALTVKTLIEQLQQYSADLQVIHDRYSDQACITGAELYVGEKDPGGWVTKHAGGNQRFIYLTDD